MPAPFRQPSPYSIERAGAFFAIRHDWHGIVLDEIESYGSAEDRDAERAEAEAADDAAETVIEIVRRAA